MARQRDIKSVIVFSESWTGIQDISLDYSGDSFLYSADANESIRRIDVTAQKFGFSISVKDPDHKRDISAPVFGSTPQVSLNEVKSISMREQASEILDSSEDDDWIAFVGVTARVVEVEIELMDFTQIMTAASFFLGAMGRFQFDVLPGSALTGLADRTAYERFSAPDMVIVGISPAIKHGDLHSGNISLKGGGTASAEALITYDPSDGNDTGFEVHTGDEGTVSFIVPSADGGSDATVSIANCVCVGVELSASHGGTLERKFDFIAYSSDGQTTPLSLS